MCGDREGKKKRGKTIRRNWKKKERERAKAPKQLVNLELG